jgi:DNA-binding FadR family transcriptional regulator
MNRRPASLPKRLHEHVVDELGARIVRGDYKPDEALPVEDALVTQLGVSRTVVREAVKVLAQKNLIQVRTRTGTRVRPRRAGTSWTRTSCAGVLPAALMPSSSVT